MKKLIAIKTPIVALLLNALFLFGCANSDQQITTAVTVAVTQAIDHVPTEFQVPLANYMFSAAQGIYSINGTPTINELLASVLSFIPKDFLDKNPYITTTITAAVTTAYVIYGKPGLVAIGKGFEAGACTKIQCK